jgi:hypothetical protein
MRTEIAQAKREAEYFKNNVEKSNRLKRKAKKDASNAEEPPKYDFHQREPDDVIRSKKKKLSPTPGGGKKSTQENQGNEVSVASASTSTSSAKRAKMPATKSNKGGGKGKKKAGKV